MAAAATRAEAVEEADLGTVLEHVLRPVLERMFNGPVAIGRLVPREQLVTY